MLGALTPTEVRAALAAGADVVKIFPASSAGGPGHIKALASVFPDVAFCPTGGVEPGNVAAYLSAGAAFVGMGGALVDEKRIAAGDKAAIQAAARALLPGGTPHDRRSAVHGRADAGVQPASAAIRTARQHYLEGHGGDTSNAAIAAARQGASVGLHHRAGPGHARRQFYAACGSAKTSISRQCCGPTVTRPACIS